jgi:hypothetical protein
MGAGASASGSEGWHQRQRRTQRGLRCCVPAAACAPCGPPCGRMHRPRPDSATASLSHVGTSASASVIDWVGLDCKSQSQRPLRDRCCSNPLG